MLRTMELQLGIRFCAGSGLEPGVRKPRSRPGPPRSAVLALEPAGRAVTAEPRRGGFVDKQERLFFWFYFLYSFVPSLVSLLALLSASLNFSSASSFSLSFRSLFFLTLCAVLLSGSPSSMPASGSRFLWVPRALCRPWARAAPSPCIIFPDSAALSHFFVLPAAPDWRTWIRLPRRRRRDLFASTGGIRC